MTEVKSFRPEVLKRQNLYALVSQSRWFLVLAEAGASMPQEIIMGAGRPQNGRDKLLGFRVIKTGL